MIKPQHIVILILLSGRSLFGQSMSVEPGDLFAKANAAYEKKRYSDAQFSYQQLTDAGYSSKELFYNLANTHYKMKKYGYAVYYYEKAKQLDPSDEDILFNLELAQLYLKDKIITPPDFFIYDISKKVKHFFTLKEWGVISMIGWYLFIGMLLLKKKRGNRRFFRIILPIMGVCFLFCIVNFGANLYTQANVREAIILNTAADVKSEPDNSGSIVFILHEGTKVQIRSDKNEWFEVKLNDGKVGWIRREDAGVL